MAEFQVTQELDQDSPAGPIGLGYALGVAGRRAEALKALTDLEQLAKVHYVTPAAQAFVYVGLGQKEMALDWLEKAYEERDNEMAFLKVDPALTALRNEQRFQALAKKVEGGGKEK